MSAPPGVVLDYDELLAAVRARLDALKAPYKTIEDCASLADGHLGKLLGPTQVKRLGTDVLFRLLETLGLRLAVVEHLDIAATIEEMGHHYRARVEKYRRKPMIRRHISQAVKVAAAREFGAMGAGIPKAFGIGTKALRRKQQKAARARWRPLGRN
jgi:hypothetical protein